MKVTPKLLAIGGIALAVIIAVVYMATSSKAGGITFAPSTFSCSSSVQVTIVMRLPASMQATDKITLQTDGAASVTDTVDSAFSRQADGSWLASEPGTAGSACHGSGGSLSIGAHTVRILDATGKVLAEGSFTLTP